MGSHRVLAAICAAVALVGAQSIPNDLQFEFVLALVTPTPSSSSNTIFVPSNIVSTPSAVVSSDASTTPRISVNPGSTTAPVAIPTSISGSVTLDTPGPSVLSTSSRLSIPISVPTPSNDPTAASSRTSSRFNFSNTTLSSIEPSRLSLTSDLRDFSRPLAHTAERNIHIVRRPLFEHRISQHVDEHHTVEHHISKHTFFKHVIIRLTIVEPVIVKHIITKHAIFKHFVIEHLVIKNLISEHLIFKQLIFKPLVVYVHVRKFYKCYPVKHLIIGFIVIAHFIFYENYIVKRIEHFENGATIWIFYRTTVETGVVGVYDHPQDGNKYAFTPFYSGVQSGFVAQFLPGLTVGRPYRLRFYYGLGILTQTGSYGNCRLTLTMPGTYSVGNTITVGNTPAGQYQLSDQIYTPSTGYNANPIIQVSISCTDTTNPAVADFLLDNFSLTDSTQCP
ncbi:hypothetical protein GQ607_003356 [Colletotrichum asianum]|uniref:Uncharacterized protein n=1 Tax=Colletotrichum asianum TaxID=702518 RepID=A0A8H3ZVL8_9PEZI|nr:hypothetical protein GQ607_003356 [Colletotrichum asianum]